MKIIFKKISVSFTYIFFATSQNGKFAFQIQPSSSQAGTQHTPNVPFPKHVTAVNTCPQVVDTVVDSVHLQQQQQHRVLCQHQNGEPPTALWIWICTLQTICSVAKRPFAGVGTSARANVAGGCCAILMYKGSFCQRQLWLGFF